jgi:hypothetical protein
VEGGFVTPRSWTDYAVSHAFIVEMNHESPHESFQQLLSYIDRDIQAPANFSSPQQGIKKAGRPDSGNPADFGLMIDD